MSNGTSGDDGDSDSGETPPADGTQGDAAKPPHLLWAAAAGGLIGGLIGALVGTGLG
ncbi:MAG TPA: hypothetical protein VJ764_05340 [Steroidobacteraceae bacterium]|nr:hypothetical protein [Steroidobacteraceae bacterium]